ncbi:MAG: sigma 54-interacting transcriptional regulator [Chitinophagales bacterium]
MQHEIKTFGGLKDSGYQPKSVKDEMRANLRKKLQSGAQLFEGILGYEDTVLPDLQRAILSRHNIILLGLRGQAKTRIARQMTELMDEYIPYVAGSEINDDPFAPVSKFARERIAEMGDKTPIAWLHRSERFGEKLATPDVSVADLIGDIDPVKAANQRLSFSDEAALHFGIIPRSNRGIFVINELPDLQARIQVALFNILQEGDIQIRGFKLRMPLDIQFIFTANPEDYTNRGSIVTPLKDRIESQILTHYPRNIELSKRITLQEIRLSDTQIEKVEYHPIMLDLSEQIAVEARESEYVDEKSGVSARLTISAFENMISAAERRMLINKENTAYLRISDLWSTVPAITGKVELVYEGEQEGPKVVAQQLISKSIRNIFKQYFPDPELLKKKKEKNPYQQILDWFSEGHHLDLLLDAKEKEYRQALDKVAGLKNLVQKYAKNLEERETYFLQELMLHGLAEYSLISKNRLENSFAFNDILGAVFDLGSSDFDMDDFNEEHN